MAADMIGSKMRKQIQKATREDQPHLLFLPDADDMRVWHVMACALPGIWRGGEYIFRLSVGDEFPQAPPKLECLTENGLFGRGGAICVSIGEFHRESWRPSLGMSGFAKDGIVNGFIVFDALDESGGIRINPLRQSKIAKSEYPRVRAELAAASRSFNRARLGAIAERFEELIESGTTPNGSPFEASRRIKLIRGGTDPQEILDRAEGSESIESIRKRVMQAEELRTATAAAAAAVAAAAPLTDAQVDDLMGDMV